MKDKVLKLQRQGYTAHAVAAMLGLGASTVARIARNAGTPFKRRRRRLRYCAYCNALLGPIAKHANKYCNVKCAGAARAAHSLDALPMLKTDEARRNLLLRLGPRKCSVCGTTEWNNQPVPLLLDHVNGHADDNSVTNLRLVCGNCNMQLPTFAGRNRGHGRFSRRQRYAAGKSS